MSYRRLLLFVFLIWCFLGYSQNSLIGDGFGGRLWYKPYNYSVGSYSGYTVCGDSFQLYGWGSNQYGQLGNGNSMATPTPVKAIGMTQVKFYSCGYIMSVIKCDSSGWVWGRINPANLNPIKVIDGVKFTDAGSHDVSFIKNDGTVWSVGSNNHGEFGDGLVTVPYSAIPQQMLSLNNAVRVANGFYTLTVLTADGKVHACGYNNFGALGRRNQNATTTVVDVDSLKGIIDIKAVDFTVIALDSAGDVYQWGKHMTTNLVDSTPVKIKQLHNIVAISGCDDGDHFFALDSSKNCWAWGRNRNTFGGGTFSAGLDTPIIVATDVVDILAGETFSYIVKKDGSLWASGLSLPIWMNIKDSVHGVFYPLNPTDSPMYLCNALPFHESYILLDSVLVCRDDSILIKNQYYKPDTTLRDSISGGPCAVDTLKLTVITQKYLYKNIFKGCEGDTFRVGVHQYTQTGNYIDSLISKKGCDSIISSKVSIGKKSSYFQYNAICNGDSVLFDNIFYKTAGNYVFHHLNKNGCDSLVSFSLQVNSPSASYNSQLICGGDSVLFGNNYYFNSGIYIDTLLNFSGCDSIRTLDIKVLNRPVVTFDYRICENESIKVGNNVYTNAGHYLDSLKTNSGCDSIIYTNITVKKVPVLNLRDTTLCEDKGQIIHLNAGLYKTYTWLPGGESTGELFVSKAGLYIVTVHTFDSCSVSDSIFVKDSCAPMILIPNVFTINGDNVNDAFDIEIKGETKYHLKIFNRWGQLVFEGDTDGIDNDGINWNGAYFNKGIECPDGVYYFLFNYRFPGENAGEYKGVVTLIRE